jgi:hypothetical protein
MPLPVQPAPTCANGHSGRRALLLVKGADWEDPASKHSHWNAADPLQYLQNDRQRRAGDALVRANWSVTAVLVAQLPSRDWHDMAGEVDMLRAITRDWFTVTNARELAWLDHVLHTRAFDLALMDVFENDGPLFQEAAERVRRVAPSAGVATVEQWDACNTRHAAAGDRWLFL